MTSLDYLTGDPGDESDSGAPRPAASQAAPTKAAPELFTGGFENASFGRDPGDESDHPALGPAGDMR